METGSISSDGNRKRAAVTSRAFAIRIGEQQQSRRTATLRAYLETPDPHATIRVDGVILTTTPIVIQRNVPLGAAITHRLEIEVPLTAPEGPLAAAIGWEAITE